MNRIRFQGMISVRLADTPKVYIEVETVGQMKCLGKLNIFMLFYLPGTPGNRAGMRISDIQFEEHYLTLESRTPGKFLQKNGFLS